MTSEPEPEVSDVASAMAAVQSASDPGDAGTLLELTFQRNPRQKYKYLEAEPKILGVTEIALTVFFISCRITCYYAGIPFGHMDNRTINIYMLAFSCVGIIAGSVAIAAQNLHQPTLKACSGMQVVTCVAYAYCLLYMMSQDGYHGICDIHYSDRENIHGNDTCPLLENGIKNLTSIDLLTAVAQIILSITLAAYCCKVIPCCSPTSHTPVIMMPPRATQ